MWGIFKVQLISVFLDQVVIYKVRENLEDFYSSSECKYQAGTCFFLVGERRGSSILNFFAFTKNKNTCTNSNILSKIKFHRFSNWKTFVIG